ncbi:MAG: M1 family aminopeptidase [Candidatus Saccharicenans sp.]|nr:M1 family aminopeptidase [Candidatus Saccharicenans sp.]
MASLFLCLRLYPAQPSAPEHLRPLVKALETRSLEAYLELCLPEIRQAESQALAAYLNQPGLESLSIFFSGESRDQNGLNRAFFQVLLQKEYSAVIEVWQITYNLGPDGLRIHQRLVSSSLKDLYRLRFPGERSTRARHIRLAQKDIVITFTEGQIFFDNLPGIETAIIIIGRGQVSFRPSDEIERNQLNRVYRKPAFEEDLEYVYVRGSDSYFQDNLLYEPVEGLPGSIPEEVLNNRVYSIFSRNYSRSFTLENSLTGELLTFLPPAGETVIELKTVKGGEFTYVYSPFAEEEISFLDRTRNRLLNSYSPQEEGQKRMFLRFGEKFEVKNYDIEASYRPESSQLAASAAIRLASTVDNLDSCQLRLNPELQILKIEDDKGRELFYSRDRFRKYLYIYLAERLPRGQETGLRIFYRGKIVPPPPLTDAGPQIRSEEPTILFSISNSFLFTQSSDWYPSPVRERFVSFRLRMIVPDGYYCLAGGRLLEMYSVKEAASVTELENLGNSIFIYESQVPVKYISFFIARLVSVKKITNGLTIEHFTTQDWRHQAKQILNDASSILEAYKKYFGPFPFERLAIAQRYWHTQGGHAPAGLVILDQLPFSRSPELIIINPSSPVDLSYWPEYYLAHELAHQWWGHGVTWTSYRDNWLTEGLAQFSTILYLEERYGQRDFEKILQKISSSVRKKSRLGPLILGIRLSHIDFEGYQAIVYNKAALALFLLKDWLGEEVFFRGLREFFSHFRFQAARTSDFRLTMERVSGQDLRPFFGDWFYSERLPEVRVEQKVQTLGSTSSLKLTVRQLSRPMVFPLRVVLETDRGKSEHVLRLESASQSFDLEFSGRLKKVRVNPGNLVPGRFE